MIIDMRTIDWKLLREQKYNLLWSHDHEELVEAGTLKGLLGLLDHIQDEAAKQIGDEAVFGKEEI